MVFQRIITTSIIVLFSTLFALGQDFVTHRVEKGETIYGIARQYSVEQEVLVKYNPLLSEGLKEGQLIMIPLIEAVPEQEIKPTETDLYILHRVVKGNTIYSLTREYGITEEQLYVYNPDLRETGLQIGMLIKIPVDVDINKKADDPDDTAVIDIPEMPGSIQDSARIKNTYRIGVVLPLYTERNDSMAVQVELEEDEQIYRMSSIALDFLNGFKFAMDSLRKQGFNAEVFIYDSEKDTTVVKRLVYLRDAGKLDVIVGPLFTECVETLARELNSSKIETPIISPFSTQPQLVYRHRNIFQIVPSDLQLGLEMTQFLINRYADFEIEVVYSKSDAEFAKPILDKLYYYLDSSKIHINQVNSATISSVARYDRSSKTIIFTPSVNRVFLTDFVTKLNALRNENIELFGLLNLRDIDVDYSYFNNLKVTIPKASYVNYSDSTNQLMLDAYHQLFHQDMNRYSLTGFDLGYFFGGLLFKYGEIKASAANIRYEGVYLLHDYAINQSGSYVNKGVKIIRIEDFREIWLR
jgi:LysM repeat protein